MVYHSKKLSNGRWGIYQNLTLLASIGCNQTCTNIIHYLTNPTEPRPSRVDILVAKSQKQVTKKYRSRKRLKSAYSYKQKNN